MKRTPSEIKADIERELGTRSLARFIQLAWPHVEPNPLRWSWHMDALCAHLEAVSDGTIRDLVICQPPGTSKTLPTSTLWPAWDWIRHGSRRFLCATYAQPLSNKNAKLHRDLVASDWYQARWPEVRIGDGDTAKVEEFGNTLLGWRISTSVGGIATGRHADVQIGDDLVKAQDAEGRNVVDPVAIEKANDFWFRTMFTRRADAATTARVMIAQRLHHEDTPQKCIDAGYVALVLPMCHDPGRRCKTSVWWVNPEGTRERFQDPRTEPGELLCPERFPESVIAKDRKALGAIAFEAQNQQNPTPRSGAIFKIADVKRWKVLPKTGIRIITVDCAFKDKKTSDFVAIQVWIRDGKNFYLTADRTLQRLNLGGTIRAIRETMARNPGAAVYVEDKANGPAVVEVLGGEVPGIHAWNPGSDSKVGRAEAVAHLFESDVYLPPDEAAPWIGEYLATLGRFPLVTHDDDVDATTMALLLLYTPRQSQYLDAVRKMSQAGA